MRNNNNSFLIISQNVRSYQQNKDKLDFVIDSLKPEVILLQEVWQVPPQSGDYTVTHKLRKKKRGGGVAILRHPDIQICKSTNIMQTNLEAVSIETPDNIYISAYLPPNSNIEDASRLLSDMTRHSKKTIYLGGDFNVNMLLNSQKTEEIWKLCTESRLFPTISKPTREIKDSETLIDNILTNSMYNATSGILVTDISDHFTTYIMVSKPIKPGKRQTTSYRQTKPENLAQLQALLHAEDWDQLLSNKSQQQMYDTFEETFKTAFDLTCPIQSRNKHRNVDREHPWMTRGLMVSRKKKEKLRLAAVKKKTPEKKEKARIYARIYYKIVEKAKKWYVNSFYEQNRNNMKKLWDFAKDAMGTKKKGSNFPKEFTTKTDKKTRSFKEIADGFNDFFSNVGPNLAKNFKNGDHKIFGKKLETTMNFQPTSRSEIEKIISKMKSKKSSGFDEVSNYIIKGIAKGISKPLELLINNSLQNGEVPHQAKIAKVVPLYKAGPADEFTNYRPISLLSIFSKIYEKVANLQLYKYCEANILSKFQFGFRRASETIHSMLNLLNNLKAKKDSKRIAIFLDLKKAFDTVDHNILFAKLEHYGIKDQALKWFKSYLTDRTQIVSFQGTNSCTMKIVCGVPQGSILGPILFLIYINDLPHCSNFLINLFADDTTLQLNRSSINELETDVNNELKKVASWFNMNKLTVHAGKTKFIIFGSKARDRPKIQLNDTLLEQIGEKQQTKTYKFLGLNIDENLTWKHHVDITANKIQKLIFALLQSRKTICFDMKTLIFRGLIRPHMEYALSIWGNSSAAQKISQLNKRVIRLVHNKSKKAHAEPLLKKSNELQTIDLYTHMVRTRLKIFERTHTSVIPFWKAENLHISKM